MARIHPDSDGSRMERARPRPQRGWGGNAKPEVHQGRLLGEPHLDAGREPAAQLAGDSEPAGSICEWALGW